MIALTDISALELYREYSKRLPSPNFDSKQDKRNHFESVDLRSFSKSRTTIAEVERLLDWNPYLSKPIHVLCSRQERRVRSDAVRNHCISIKRPAGLLVSVDGIYSVSPEACFVQMATWLPMFECIQLGFELCGYYAIPNYVSELETDQDNALIKRHPLTTPERIGRFLKTGSSLKGAKKAKAYLPYVQPHSASPMETELALLLCLPKRYGGYGLPIPKLNHPVKLMDSRGKTQLRFCDLMWTEANVALEYDSDEFHTGKERIARDSARRALLLSHGIDVISVTRTQVRSMSKLDDVVRALANKLHWRLRRLDADWRNRQFKLSRELIYRRTQP